MFDDLLGIVFLCFCGSCEELVADDRPYCAVFLPLLGALIAVYFGRVLNDRGAQWVDMLIDGDQCLFVDMGVCGCGSWGNSVRIHLAQWVLAGDFTVDWALRIDALTAVMLVVVTVVSCMVHIYSIGYMHHDKSVAAFYVLLSLFTFLC